MDIGARYGKISARSARIGQAGGTVLAVYVLSGLIGRCAKPREIKEPETLGVLVIVSLIALA